LQLKGKKSVEKGTRSDTDDRCLSDPEIFGEDILPNSSRS